MMTSRTAMTTISTSQTTNIFHVLEIAVENLCHLIPLFLVEIVYLTATCNQLHTSWDLVRDQVFRTCFQHKPKQFHTIGNVTNGIVQPATDTANDFHTSQFSNQANDPTDGTPDDGCDSDTEKEFNQLKGRAALALVLPAVKFKCYKNYLCAKLVEIVRLNPEFKIKPTAKFNNCQWVEICNGVIELIKQGHHKFKKCQFCTSIRVHNGCTTYCCMTNKKRKEIGISQFQIGNKEAFRKHLNQFIAGGTTYFTLTCQKKCDGKQCGGTQYASCSEFPFLNLEQRHKPNCIVACNV